MYKAKSFILKTVIGAMGFAGIAICAIACIPGSMESSSKEEGTKLDGTVNQDTSIFADHVQDGQILQCFCWSYKEIMEYLPKIANQGFTAIQTSPVQVCKEGTTGGKTAKGSWWAYYQPAAFTVDDTGDNALGTPEEFKAMCDMAHSYGVKVLVDVVANHLGNQWVADSLCERAYYYEWEIAGMQAPVEDGGYIPYTGEVWAYGGGTTTPGSANASTTKVIDTYYYKDTLKFHPYLVQDNDDPGNVTQGNIGMMDLDTSDPVVQDAVADYLEELIDYGVDGFRFDAAKHIETQWDSISSTFWPTVMERAYAKGASCGREIYAYGEILNRPGIGRKLSWYTNNGVAITDSGMGHNIVENGGVGHGSFNGADGNNYEDYKKNMVTWAESHDNYMGTQDTHNKSEAIINKAYAILSSRRDFATLYCARFEDYEKSILGDVACLNGWSYPEVGAVNKFHNFFSKANADENCYQDNGYTVTERFVDSYSLNNGVVLVGNSGDASVAAAHLADGVYVDQVTGNAFTASNGTISGVVGESGIAVIYNQKESTAPSIHASMESQTIYTDTLDVTYTFKNAVSAVVKVGSDTVSATSEYAKVSLSGIEEGQTVSIVITVLGKDGSELVNTYSYTRYASIGKVLVYFNNSQNWDKVNVYAWNDTTKKTNTGWPGVLISDTIKDYSGNTCYKYEFDADEYDHIIFNNGYDQTVDIKVSGSCEYTLDDMVDGKYNVSEEVFLEYQEPVDDEDIITVDFQNDKDWNQVYAYMWRGGYNNSWPGVALKSLGYDTEGHMAYSIEVDLTEFDHIIFNNGSGDKTPDLDLTSETTGYTYDGTPYDYVEGTGIIDPVDPIDPVEDDTISIVFKNDHNWDKVYAYIWNDATSENTGSWPGNEISSIGKDKDGYNAYSVSFDTAKYDRIIFTNGNGDQTINLEVTKETTGFDFDGNSYSFIKYVDPDSTEITVYFKNTAHWDEVMVYLWHSSTYQNNQPWPGEVMTKVGVDGDCDVYAITVNLTEFDRIIFNNNNGKQTKDLTLTYTTTGFTANGSSYIYAG